MGNHPSGRTQGHTARATRPRSDETMMQHSRAQRQHTPPQHQRPRPGTPSVPRPSGDLAQPPTNHAGENVPAAPAQVPSPSGAPVGGPKVPVMFRWNGDGHRVSLVGTFNNWKTHLPMVRSGQEFYQIVEVPRGFHQYAFDVDGEMKYASEQPVTHEDDGTMLNYIDLTNYRPYVPQPLGSAPHVKLTPEEDAEFGTKEVLPPEPAVAFGPGSHMGPSSSTNSQEPPIAPSLLLKSSLLAAPPDTASKTASVVLMHKRGQIQQPVAAGASASDAFLAATRNPDGMISPALPSIAMHAVCTHVFHDASRSFQSPLAEVTAESLTLATVTSRYDQKFSTCIMLQSAAPSNVDPHSSDYRYHYQHHRPEDDKEAEKLAGLSRRYPAQILPEAHQHPPRVVRDPILDVVTTPPMVNKAERSPQVAKAV
ncbi:5-amp-activated protein kinase, beta subunit, putative [Perkinsus marinus ATCC 50983]|uniref:5-amp-activated protein kinase, beta subunit, putative n=1 Tax=Perkinsus marinus (strain ATCC 50983 / TXsc) TaxID=423536 RepID=C5LGF8_PERM5|nr:5-amp-activated protein kinase, beta subunit, putative [Perkinsus marinus ATCC 50983]EER04144.1 5-amp-activated protein kinase, beta subunit, putative [Perkinsus marinus ATCC 50983]|eukprot:XP_002772328.1 5-amp-activated protein kinase, beta subunit, putative [Perkinsus marinus ATCC 50983]